MKSHSTMSRRDFMKALGLTAAGAAAVGAASPVIHDLDELLQEGDSGKFGVQKHPWWVKKRKLFEPTVEVDWTIMKRYNRCYQTQTNFTMSRYVDRPTRTANTERMNGETANKQKAGGPGWDAKWRALSNARSATSYSTDWSNNYQTHTTSGFCEPITLTNNNALWNKSNPDLNAKILNAAMRYFGAIWVGYQPLAGYWRNNMIVEATTAGATMDYLTTNGTVPRNVQLRYEYNDNDDRPKVVNDGVNGNNYIIPTKEPQNIIVYATGVSQELGKCHNSPYRSYNGTTVSNFHTDIAARTNRFLRALGCGSFAYGNVGHQASETNYGGAMVFAGLSEHSRQNLFSITPETGPANNPCNIMTNFPLTPTTPIDAGIWKFCQTCGKCADSCPSESIPFKSAGKPTYDIPTKKRVDGVEETWTWTVGGRKVYFMDFITCMNYRGEQFTTCSLCYNNCVFAEDKAASIHNIVRGTVANTSIFNSFFGSKLVADSFGFGEYENADIWWDMHLPAFGVDTTIGAGKGYR